MSALPLQKIPGATGHSGLPVLAGNSAPTMLKCNLTAVADPGVTDDSGSGYAAGSLWVNTSGKKIWWCADAGSGAAVWQQVVTAGAVNTIKETITVSNSLAAGNVVRRTSGSYVLAKADSSSDAEVQGVIESASGSSFVIVYFGKVNLASHGFTVGATLFLSAGTAGLLTETEPNTQGQISKPVGLVLDANYILVMNMRGMTVGTPSTFDSLAPTTTKGDLIANNGSTNIRLAVGSDGQILIADSSQTSGVKWGAKTGSYAIVADQKTVGTDGGDAVSGSDQVRVINTELADPDSICSIASNQITLSAGTYRCRIRASAFNVDRHQALLYNATGAVEVLRGTSEYSTPGAYAMTASEMVGRFTIAAGQALEVRHRFNQSTSGNGCGRAANFGTETYLIAEFYKE